MSGDGNYDDLVINGSRVESDTMGIQWTHQYMPNDVLVKNTGFHQSSIGIFDPAVTFNGLVNSTPNAVSAHNTLSPQTEQDYYVSLYMGQNAPAQAGDPALIGKFTLSHYKADPEKDKDWNFDGKFVARGMNSWRGNLLVKSLAKNTVTSTPFDRGANANAGTLKGALFILQVDTPTGTAATGSVTIAANAVAADTLVFNGVTYTFRAAVAAINDILIGATALATMQNLYAALIGGLGSGTAYFAGSTLAPSTILLSFNATTGAITVTYATTGTAGNAFTLVRAGTGGVAVSGPTLAGGVAGETGVCVVSSATTSGGAYTTLGTFVADMTKRTAEAIIVPYNTTVNRFLKVVNTMSGGTMTCGFSVAGAAGWY